MLIENSVVKQMGRLVSIGPRDDIHVFDRISGNDRRARQAIGFLHLKPGLNAELVADESMEGKWRFSLIDASGIRRRLRFWGVESVVSCVGMYCPDFGVKVERTVLSYTAQLPLRHWIGWSLTDEESTVLFESDEVGLSLTVKQRYRESFRMGSVKRFGLYCRSAS